MSSSIEALFDVVGVFEADGAFCKGFEIMTRTFISRHYC